MPDRILPCYVVCDESSSMADHLEDVGTGLRALRGALLTDPVVAGTARLCVIGFSGTARIVTPLSAPDGEPAWRGPGTGTETNFGVVFSLLRETIQRDVEVLQAECCVVYRPVVFFLSDGQPTDADAWPAAHARLADRAWPARPRIVAFGVGDADRATIGRIGTHRAYLSTGEASQREAVRAFASTLTSTVVAAGRSGDVDLPRQVTGFTALETGSPGHRSIECRHGGVPRRRSGFRLGARTESETDEARDHRGRQHDAEHRLRG
ncbi:hypothetical protein ACFWY9_28200 [Amycolatopsis sp. NPDC059027]|uniref:vWA domain-containing protein n=1 Tax=unclassified Amycolatopsis TaxID=2618356 RepID=UPI00366BFB5D